MKYVRNLALLAVVMLLTWSVGGGTAFGQAFTVLTPPYDTVANNAKDISLLKVNLTGFTTSDTLISVKLKSYIEKEYAINKITLWKNAATTPFKSYTVSGRFDANYEATLAGFNVPLDADDTLIVKVDAWTDSVDTDTSYHMTGLELVIPPEGLIVKHGPAANTTYFTDFVANPAIDATTGLWIGTPVYVVRYDLYAPTYDVSVTVLDTTTAPNTCLTTVNIGDSIAIVVDNPNEKIQSNSVKVNLSKFGGNATHPLNYHAGLDSTTLTSDAAAGDNHAHLTSAAGLAIGSIITLRNGTNTETRTLTAVAGNVVTWVTVLVNTYTVANGVIAWPNFANSTWTDTVKVLKCTSATGLDVIAGYVIYFTAKDLAGNTGTVQYQFTEPIDDIAPKFDSLKFYISQNVTGSDTSAALGDKLTLIAYMTSNGYFEISSVKAVDSLNNFRSDTTVWQLVDFTNGNNVWRLDMWLTNPLARDLPKGDSLYKHIYLTAIDNACNVAYDTANLTNAIDLEPPLFSTMEYHTIANLDSSGCTNLGDSVRVAADLSGSADIVRVYGDFLHAGINGSNTEDLADLGTGTWAKRWKIGSLTDPTKDPDPLYSKGLDNVPAHVGWDDFTVMVYAIDDAGNLDSLRTGALTPVVGGGAATLDTRRPSALLVDNVSINKLPAGKLQLKWPASYPSQAGDATWFYIYVDSTGAGFDYTKVFGTTFNTEYRHTAPDSNAWTSEYLTDSKTYRFVVRTKDNCGNPEFNTNVFQAEADAKAPVACVVFPDTGKYYGPDKALNITATTTGVDLDSAWITYRRLDVPSGTWGAWQTWRGSNYMTIAGQTLYENVALGSTPATKGYYELYVLTKDLAGNVLLLDSAKACSKFSFFWNPDVLAADIVSINGATSPQTPCGFDVWRDSVNTAVVSVTGPVADSVYTIDSWVIFYDVNNRDSVRIEFKDLQKVPYTYSFSVFDWPKSFDGINTTLYVRITDTRNGSAGIDSARLCVPDVVAPDIYMTYPTAYQRVPIAKSSLNTVPVRAKIGTTSYDPDSPVRVEFFYALDGTTLTWVKIGETGTPYVASKGFTGSTALISNPYPEYQVAWDNSKLAEGFVWLKAIVHDNKDNTKEAPAIKVYLDKTAPLMKLTMPDAIMVNGKLTIVKPPDSDEYINLVAEITNNTIDIANVDFFISYRDSVDLVKFYHEIGSAYAGTNNSIWRYRWNMSGWPWSGTAGSSYLTSSASPGNDHVHLSSVSGIVVGTPVTLSGGGGGSSRALSGHSEPLIVDHVSGTTVYFTTNLVYSYSSQDDATWLGAWFKCGYDYKLRVKVTDIAGNVYDDMDGDGQFDDYTFWANPFAAPITLNTPADLSKLIFKLDCGAPQVAISQVDAGGRTYETPSSKLGGPAEVYMKKGETLAVKSVVLDSLFDLGGVKKVEYFFYSPVYGAYKSVGFATASPFNISFDPFALGLITQADVQVNEYDGGIEAVLTDSLGQTTSDEITCWVLDTFPGESKWKTPTHTYVWGTVDLSIWALNGERYHNSYRQVVYKYMPIGGSTWTTIATVLQTDGASQYFAAQWPTLNMVADGSYILGFETTDKNLNVQPIENNPQITVIVQNALPTVTIASPANGTFFCDDQYFTAEATNGPVGVVDFQYKSVTSSSWTRFPYPSDNFAPWGKYLESDSTNLSDGYYHFRAYATNQAGRTAYSEPITLFFDETAPLARLTKLDAKGDTADVEYKNDGSVSVNKAVGTLHITAVAFDTLSPVGSQAIYNSGVAWVGLYLTIPGGPAPVELAKEYPNPADSGYYTFTWDISGLAEGEYKLAFEAYDKVGCNVGVDTIRVDIYESRDVVSLVAGYWHSKIVGLTESYAGPVQFQYKQGNGDWIPIGIGYQVASKDMNVYDGIYRTYVAYAADWKPADGAYSLRMLTSAGDEFAPVLGVTIANGVATVTSNPATGFPAISIERSLENNNVVWGDSIDPSDCEILGIARIASTYGYPYGIAMDYNVENEEYGFNIIPFRVLPQQGTTGSYGGPFEFWQLDGDDGGYGSGQVFVFDYAGTVGFSQYGHMDTYWITRDFGSGGPVSYYDGSLTVEVPQEWTDDNVGMDNSLLLWKTQMARPNVYADYLLTPIGDGHGMMNYVGNPGCWENCGSDQQYAIIKMSYDPSVNIPQESLMVAYWDGEGGWRGDYIHFPSTVAGFNTTAHTVEFAVTCLNEYYAVVKRTPYTGMNIVTRKNAFPMCDGYTSGRPVFWYQFMEAFPYSIDWSTLEVKVDGIMVYDGGYYGEEPVKGAPTETTLDGTARRWDIDVDDVSAVVSVHYRPAHEGVLDDPLPLDCGSHTIWIGARDFQGRGQYLQDPFLVDCTKPVVTFPNKYVGKDPTIQFTITDDHSGVEWDSVFVDVFFVTRVDSSVYGYDYYSGEERVDFIQSFYPGQIENYLTGSTVTIPTSYNLENVRAMIAVVYDGHRRTTDSPNNWGIDPTGDNFNEYYLIDGGAPDCVGNYATPHVQFFTVDAMAPSITRTSTTTTCPMVFTIADNGSGVSADDIVIRENDVALPSSARQSSAAAVNSGGKWFFAPSGGGGLLYYCPTAGTTTEFMVTDAVGNIGSLLLKSLEPLRDGDLTVTMSQNPFDPTVEGLTLGITLSKSATVTAKIYDMGGDLVRALDPMVGGNLFWDGKTSRDGSYVANGVYLAHIVAEGGGGSVSTVVKIAVIKK